MYKTYSTYSNKLTDRKVLSLLSSSKKILITVLEFDNITLVSSSTSE